MLKYILPLVLVLGACSNNEKTAKEDAKKEEIVVHLDNEKEMDKRMNQIDSILETSDYVANSLRYDKGDGIFVEVLGYLDEKNVVLKFVEEFSDGNGKNNGRKIFYMNNGIPFITREVFDEVINQQGTFVDRISYYDQKGKVIKTKERRAGFETDAENLPFKPVALHAVSVKRAMDVMNSKGEYATTFQGFVESGPMTYIIVGEDKADGYTSALRLDYKDQLIQMLYASQESYLGEPLKVNFQVHEDRGFEFQVYAGGQFETEKK